MKRSLISACFYLILASTLFLIITACGDAPTPAATPTPVATNTPIVIFVIVTPTSQPVEDSPTPASTATSVPTTVPTETPLPPPTPTIISVPSFQSGGLGLTEADWRNSSVSNLPKAPFQDTNFTNGNVSFIEVGYGGEGIGDDLAPLTQARADSRKLLPVDATLVSEGRIYQRHFYYVGLDTYVSPSLAARFQTAGVVWEGGQPGVLTVEYTLYRDNTEVGLMRVSAGKRGPVLRDWGIDPDVANKAVPSGIYTDAEVNDNDVNFRTGPGFNYPSLAKLNKGVRLTVTGKDVTGEWLEVFTSDGGGLYGWMMTQYIKVNINLASVPVASAPPTPESQPAAGSSQESSWDEGYGDGIRLTVLRLRDRQEVGYSDADNGEKFVLFTMLIDNESATTIFVSPLYFTLFGTNGVGYSYDAATYQLPVPFRSVRLEPGARASETIVFSVPNGFTPAKLVLESFSYKVVVPLRER